MQLNIGALVSFYSQHSDDNIPNNLVALEVLTVANLCVWHQVCHHNVILKLLNMFKLRGSLHRVLLD